jgi:exportin-5
MALFPHVQDSESVLMYEMLVLVSTSLPSLTERCAFIQHMISEPLAQWTSREMTALVIAPDALIRAIEGEHSYMVLTTMMKVLSTLYAIVKRTITCEHYDENAPHRETASVSSSSSASVSSSSVSSSSKNEHGIEDAAQDSMHHPLTPLWAQLMPNVLALLSTLESSVAAVQTRMKRPSRPSTTTLVPPASLTSSTSSSVSSSSSLPLVYDTNNDSKSSLAFGLRCMSQEEVVHALKASGKDDVPIRNLKLLQVAKWGKNIRDLCYHLVGAALSAPSFYRVVAISQLHQWIHSSLVSRIDRMEHRHWKAFLASVWIPFVKGCPAHLYASTLEPMVLLVLTHLHARFHAALFQDHDHPHHFLPESMPTMTNHGASWNPQLHGFEDMHPSSSMLNDDIVLDVVLTDAVRNTVDWIEAMIDSKTVIDMDSNHPKHVIVAKDKQLRDFLLFQSSSPRVMTAMSMVLMGILNWKDTLSSRRAANLLDRFVSLSYHQIQFQTLFGKDIFTASLHALLQHFHDVDDGLKWELINLLRNIYCRITLGLLPVDECKGIDPLNQPLKPPREVSSWPRQIFLQLAGVVPAQIADLEHQLRHHPSLKIQKNLIKEFLEVPFLSYIAAPQTNKQIEDLPETLVIRTNYRDMKISHHYEIPSNDEAGVAALFQE